MYRAMRVAARIVSLPLARDLHDLARVAGRRRARRGRDRARRRHRLRRGGADRALRPSAASALAYVEANGDSLGDDPFALEEILERLPPEELAARGAIDAALHDLQGKLLGRPVWQLLGLRREGPPTSWTIWLGDPDDMARRAEKVGDRFRRLKLKLGGGDGLDVERVRAVRARRPSCRCRSTSTSTGRSTRRSRRSRSSRARRRVLEQPLPAGDEGGRELKRESPLPIYVDEDCHTLGDVAALRRARARDQHQAREVGRHPRGGAGWRTRPARSGSA